MRIKLKLISGFIIAAILVGLVGGIGLYANNMTTGMVKTQDERFGGIFSSTAEVISFSKRAEGHLMMYIMLDNREDRDKFFQRIASLHEHISILDKNIKDSSSRLLLSRMKAGANRMEFVGVKILAEYDRDIKSKGYFEPDDHEELIRELHKVSSDIRVSAVELTEFETELHDSRFERTMAQVSFFNEMIVVLGGLSILGALSFGIYLTNIVSNPIIRLKKGMERAGKGELDISIKTSSNDEIGDLTGVFNKMIIDLRTSTEQIEASRTFLFEVISSMSDSLIVLKEDRTIKTINNAVIESSGYTEHELIGQPVELLLKDNKKGKSSVFSMICKGNIKHVNLLLNKKDGDNVPVFFSSSLLKDSSGLITGIVCVVHDISENIKIEKMEVENEKLEYLSKAKSEFLSNMSHELRTPLNSIIGFSNLLKNKLGGDLTKKQERYTNNILESSKFLLSLINDILDLSKVESGKMELSYEKVSVPEIIDVSFKLIKEYTSKNNVQFNSELDPELEFVEGDRQRIKQILFNLLSNAVKFSKDEGGVVTVITEKEGNYAKISVSDTGIGIKQNNISKIFDKFTQENSGVPGKYGGTGLGLSITKNLVELHGGTITVESKHGEGSTFTFSIPVKKKRMKGKVGNKLVLKN